MRERERVLQSLESVYRDAFEDAKQRGDQAEMARLDLEYQREQLHFELLLDIRALLSESPPAQPAESKETSILEKAQTLRKLTKLPRGLR